jgi:hypothetical protein
LRVYTNLLLCARLKLLVPDLLWGLEIGLLRLRMGGGVGCGVRALCVPRAIRLLWLTASQIRGFTKFSVQPWLTFALNLLVIGRGF